MNFNNQLELEEHFDISDRRKLLDEVYAETSMKVSAKQREEYKVVLKGASDDQLDECLFELIALASMESNGAKAYKIYGTNSVCEEFHPNAEYQKERVMSLEGFLSSVFGMRSLKALFAVSQERYEIALSLILAVQSPLFKVKVNQKVKFENGWKTINQVILPDVLPPFLAEKFEFDWFLPPMLTQPLEWHEGEIGGYLINPKPMVKGRGYQAQPERVCHALNVQQSMVWELNKWSSVAEEIEWTTEQNAKVLSAKYQERDLKELVRRVTVSLEASHNILKDKNAFHFMWNYDYRGRSYSHGYNQSPQGNKYKKGAINAKANVYK